MKTLIKRDYLTLTLVTLLLGFIGFAFINNQTTLATALIGSLLGVFGVFFAFFYPTVFCYFIIFLAPLSINITDLTGSGSGGLALSLPAEGMLGLLVLLSFIKLLSGTSINKQILRHPITIILIAHIIWMILTSMFSTMPEISFKRIVLKISFILGFYLIFSHLFKSKKEQKMLMVLYGVGLIIPIINAILTHSQFNFSQEESFEMTEPFYEDHTVYGACLAFVIPFFVLYSYQLIKKEFFALKSIFFLFVTILIIIGEILSYSRAGWISVIGAFGILFITQFKIPPKYYLYIATIAIAVFSLKFNSIYQNVKSGDAKKSTNNAGEHLETVTDLKSNASNLERINRWVCAYRMFEVRPFTGWGPGTYQFQYAQFQTNEFTTEISSNAGDKGNSHSEYLTLLSEEGILGLILFILVFIYSVGRSLGLLLHIKDKNQRIILYGFFLGLVTFYAHGLFNTFSDYEKMSILVYGSLAGIVAIDIQHTKKETNKS